MARKSQTKTIGKNTYRVEQMDAIEALKAQTYLAKIISPVVSKLDFSDTKALNKSFIAVLPHLLGAADDNRFHEFFISMTHEAFCNGKRVEFNECFNGNLKEAYQVFAFVLEVNFADFIKDVLGSLGEISPS